MIKVLSIGNTNVKEGNHSVNNISYHGGVTLSPMESFHYIIQHQPDIIVFATELDNLEHLTVFQRIRNMYAGKCVPIIILVHEENESLYEDYYEDGITVGLHRNIDEENLYLHIEQLVERCRQMKKSILVVDQDPVILHTYRRFLGEKYTVNIATSTKEAIKYLMSGSVDAIISGITNADTIDLSFLKILRKKPEWCEIPNIAQIDANNREILPEILSYGVRDCLIKPVDKETILTRMENVFCEEARSNLKVETGKKRILLVDKQGVSYYSIRNSLIGHYDCICTLPGVRAASILEEEHIDVIILNLDNGLFCLNKIMEKACIKRIPIMLYTSNIKQMEKQMDEQTRKSPCINCILDLPVNKKILLDRLELAI